MKTRAAVMYKHNEPVVIEELELDEPKANEVLVRTAASGVCHSDLSVVTGANLLRCRCRTRTRRRGDH